MLFNFVRNHKWQHARTSYGVSFLLWSNHQVGLLTSFYILFDMPKEDIGNSNQPERERERGQKGYLSRQIVSKGTINSLASKQASKHLSFRVFRVSCLRYLPHCAYLSYLPQFEPGGIVYRIPIEPDECPRITKASKPVSQSVSVSISISVQSPSKF